MRPGQWAGGNRCKRSKNPGISMRFRGLGWRWGESNRSGGIAKKNGSTPRFAPLQRHKHARRPAPKSVTPASLVVTHAHTQTTERYSQRNIFPISSTGGRQFLVPSFFVALPRFEHVPEALLLPPGCFGELVKLRGSFFICDAGFRCFLHLCFCGGRT